MKRIGPFIDLVLLIAGVFYGIVAAYHWTMQPVPFLWRQFNGTEKDVLIFVLLVFLLPVAILRIHFRN